LWFSENPYKVYYARVSSPPQITTIAFLNDEGKRIYKGDPIYEFLNNARRKAEAIETQLLEVEMANANEGNYEATKYNVLIVITEFLGDVASIGYDIYVRGNPIIGTATIADGKPTFVEKL
jgi:hypothetical protein